MTLLATPAQTQAQEEFPPYNHSANQLMDRRTSTLATTKQSERVNSSCWKIDQRFTGFPFQGFGGQKNRASIDLTNDKFHLAWKNSKAQMLFRAPDWKVRTWNDWHSDTTDFEAFTSFLKGKSTDRYVNGLTFGRGKTGIIAGLKATEFHTVPKDPTTTNDTTVGASAGSPSASVWFADEIRVSAEIAAIFGMLYAAPNIGNFPLEVTIRDGDGRVIRKIECISASKVTPSASAFKLPPSRSPGKVYQPSLFIDK
ncbi:hypothetical protein KF728_29125 [Candidatus Obscuribacterales bacterium]|nr:hypothetical protein [Candidatus Obscuribacterales bacterium]